MKINKVTLNLGEYGQAAPPNDGPPMTINGTPINHLLGVDIRAKADEMTMVTCSFYAEVEGDIFVKDGEIAFGDASILDKQ